MGKSIEPPEYHVVEQGDWLGNLAAYYGFPDWKTIWNHGNNAGLKAKRKYPWILFPGDKVFIPEPETKSVNRPTDASHPFVVKRPMATLTVRILDHEDKPEAGEKYVLSIPGWKEYEGKTDGEGQLHHDIPVLAEIAYLKFDKKTLGAFRQTITLHIAHLDPIDEDSGVEGRLNNLGYDPGPINGITGPIFRDAVRAHQKFEKLPITGNLDAAAKQKLEDKHKC